MQNTIVKVNPVQFDSGRIVKVLPEHGVVFGEELSEILGAVGSIHMGSFIGGPRIMQYAMDMSTWQWTDSANSKTLPVRLNVDDGPDYYIGTVEWDGTFDENSVACASLDTFRGLNPSLINSIPPFYLEFPRG